jgi:glycosyltransferase involved in cell wall biosynthesis
MTKKTADILFIHNNFPGQYRLLAKHLASFPGLRVFAIGSHTATDIEGVRLQRYRVPKGGVQGVHLFAQRFALECKRAEQIIYAASLLRLEGMAPKVIFVHPGWGESLPLRQLFPNAKICVYCEFYYSPTGADVGFDPEFQGYGVDGQIRIQLRNASTLLALVDADVGIAPTKWQRSVFPSEFRDKIRVLHDGIDVESLTREDAIFTSPTLPMRLRTGDEVLTFVARNLEPYRGFHTFMRALPRILAARPKAHICIVGGSGVSYGSAPLTGGTWKDVMLNEVGSHLDMTRVHFLGRLPYEQFITLLRVSRAHVYLTYPFVLSWSLLEALALGCTVVASDVAPVREVISHGQNGLLVPFFDTDALARKSIEVLQSPETFESIRRRASSDVRSNYCFERNILPQFQKLFSELAPDIAEAAAA